MTSARRRALAALLVSLAVVASACANGSGGAARNATGTTTVGTGAKEGGVFRQSLGEPSAIDPYNASESNGIRVTRRLFVGLTTFDGNPDLKMRPGVAETWAPNDGCTQWTFNLRRSKFSNGEDVTAESFTRGWTRTVDGRSASRVAYHLAGVQGYNELHGTEGSPPSATTFSGLSAPNPQTLVVRLTAADCEFDKKTLHPALSPVPGVAGGFDNKSYNEAPIGNGAFMLKPGSKWEHDRGISLVRSDSYFGPRPHLDGIEFVIFPGSSPPGTTFKAFEAGELDVGPPSTGQRAAAEAKYGPQGGFLKRLPYAVSYLRVNVGKGPLQNPDARRAVSLAIDRDAISKAIGEGFWTPATALVPPPFGNYYQPDVCDVCRLDPARAKELAAKGGLTSATHLRFLSSSGSSVNPLAQALKDQIEKILGVVVDLEGFPLAEALAREKRGDYDLASFSWLADYPTTENFLFPLLGKGSGDNTGGYDNAEFDTLIQQARTQRSDAERKRLLQSAERMAIGRDVALIPGFYQPTLLAFEAQKWTGVDLDFFGHLSFDTLSLK